MRLGPGVGIESRLISLVSGPIDETGMMLGDKNSPLLDGKMTDPFLDRTLFIDIAFVLGFAVSISASIHRIGENMMDGRISRSDPADRTWLARGRLLQRQRQALRAEPEPHATRRTELGKTFEYGADGAGNGLVRMKQNFPILFSPKEAHRQAAAQFPTRRLVADAAVQPCANDM
jgi:hypothetical protein